MLSKGIKFSEERNFAEPHWLLGPNRVSFFTTWEQKLLAFFHLTTNIIFSETNFHSSLI